MRQVKQKPRAFVERIHNGLAESLKKIPSQKLNLWGLDVVLPLDVESLMRARLVKAVCSDNARAILRCHRCQGSQILIQFHLLHRDLQVHIRAKC